VARDAQPLHQSTPSELKARIEAEREGKPFLALRDSVGAQRLITLEPGAGALSVGRDAGAVVRVEWDSKVSRLHATLEPIGGSWTVSDDGLSKNGTFVNNTRVTGRRRLSAGDVITVGDTSISYYEPSQGDEAETSLGEDVVFDADLSRTQRRVLAALCRPIHERGSYATPATNQEIADEVFLSTVAVKTHLRTLFAKFGLSDLPQNSKRAALAEAALKSGAVSEADFDTKGAPGPGQQRPNMDQA
jgi:pSer/pThr/pTyr-binding forkhead associated (FHA) protein